VGPLSIDPFDADLFLDDERPERERKRPRREGDTARALLTTPEAMSREEIIGRVVTYDDMRKALGRLLRERGMSQDEINKLAMYLLSFFGFSDAIIDNILDTEDRDVFYMLEEEGILTTSREEAYTLRGKIWRVHYWVLQKREILRLCAEVDAEEEARGRPRGEFDVYDEVDPNVWRRRG